MLHGWVKVKLSWVKQVGACHCQSSFFIWTGRLAHWTWTVRTDRSFARLLYVVDIELVFILKRLQVIWWCGVMFRRAPATCRPCRCRWCRRWWGRPWSWSSSSWPWSGTPGPSWCRWWPGWCTPLHSPRGRRSCRQTCNYVSNGWHWHGESFRTY